MPIQPLKQIKKYEEELEEIAKDAVHKVEEKVEDVKDVIDEITHTKKKRLHQKPHFWVLGVFLVIIIFLGISYFKYWLPIRSSLVLAKQTQTAFEQVQNDLLNADFVAAKHDIETAQKLLVKLDQEVDKLYSPLMISYLKNQYQGVESVIEATQEFSDGLLLLVDLSQDVLSKVQRDTQSGNLTISAEQRREILDNFSRKTPELNGAKAQIDLALISLNTVPVKKLNSALAEYVLTLRAKMALLRGFLDKSVSVSESLPSVLGLDKEKTYYKIIMNYDQQVDLLAHWELLKLKMVI